MENSDKVVNLLNSALSKDPDALNGLLTYSVNINSELENGDEVYANYSTLRPLGLINGILTALGVQRVAAKFDDNGKIVGFVKYE